MRFHVLGVSFAPTNKEFSYEGFSQKVRLFCKLMYDLGHTVYHYGVEGSNPICTENIDVVSTETYDKVHKSYDSKKTGFSYQSETDAQEEFNYNAIIQIDKRKHEHDFLCFSFGFPQRPVYDAHEDMIACEIGIGFDGSFAPNRVFESYAWMHTIYGLEGKLQTPNLYDAVIPNYYDLDDYIFSEEKDDYFFFIARQDPSKGLEIALKSAEHVGSKLLCAGVGEPHLDSPNLINIGVVDIEQRAKLMSRARATFVPTNYIEPFGSTVIESMLCGTPVISTDFGAFTETVIHGHVGYRCRTLEQFYWATENIDNIKPIDCRNYAVNNYSMERISEKYEEFFGSLYKLSIHNDGWYQQNLNRKNLNWLNKYIPEVKKLKEIKKPILCFLAGYTDNVNRNDILVNLAEDFSKKYNVLIFGDNFEDVTINGIKYLNIKHYEKFNNENTIDIIILYEYITNFIENNITSKNIFLWKNNNFLPYLKGIELKNNGIGFIKNILHKINKIVTTNDNFYDIDKNKICTINHNKNITNQWYDILKNNLNNE